jgi:hypothetical protein
MTMQAAELDAFQLAPVLQLVVNRSGQSPAKGTCETLFTSARGGPFFSHSACRRVDSQNGSGFKPFINGDLNERVVIWIARPASSDI